MSERSNQFAIRLGDAMEAEIAERGTLSSGDIACAIAEFVLCAGEVCPDLQRMTVDILEHVHVQSETRQ